MSGSYLLTGKFSSAKLPEVCVPRRALLRAFDRSAEKSVIFVSSPAGYGKTVSTLQWLNNSGRKTIWIGLDEYDNTPSIFYKLFCTGILSIQPDNKAMVKILRSPGFASAPVEHTISFLSEFIPDGKQYALVFDDIHLLTNEVVRRSGFLVRKRLPLSFVTLFLTRNEVADEDITAMGGERSDIIPTDNLAFSAEEILAYFRGHGRHITEEQALAVHSITGGWAIGINALVKSGQIELERKGEQILENYINEHFWNTLDGDMRDFMLKTSVADEMNAALCNMQTGRNDSREILENLNSSNSFISRIGEDSYRYHHLFLDFLRRQAAGQGISLKETHKRTAVYYIGLEDYYTAKRHAIKSGDADTIMRTVHSFNQYTDQSLDEYVNFSKTFIQDALPEFVCEKFPYLYSSHVWFCYLCGNAQGVEYYMDKLYHYIPVIAERFPQFLETSYLLTGLDHRTHFSKQIERFRRLPPLAYVHDTTQGASLTLQMPFLHRSSRDYYEMQDDELMEEARATYGVLLKGGSEIIFACIAAGLLYEQNKLIAAAEKISFDENLAKKDASPEVMFSFYLHLAAIHWVMGDNKRFNEIINKTKCYIKESGADYLHANFMAYKTKILLMNGGKAAAKEWLDNYFVTETGCLELYKVFQSFTTARAYIVLAQTEKAMTCILKLKQLVTDFKRPLDTAEASALQAVLEWALGRKKEACATLEAALAAMQEYSFIRVFADEGAAILPVLKKILQSLKKEGYNGSLQVQYVSEVTIAAYKQSRQRKGVACHINEKPVRLSKQQKLILTLLSRGYKYTEIMDETGLTIHTVKSHASAAYAKLDVHNSMDAVLKARELKLLEPEHVFNNA